MGASSAYQIAKQGRSVLLLDAHPFGTGASGNSAAMLEFQLDSYRGEPFFSLGRKSAQLFPDLWEETKQLTGIDFQYEQCGILQLALNDREAEALEREATRQKKLGLKIDWLTPDALSMHMPHLAVSSFGGVIYWEDGQVNGEKFLSALLQAAEKKGAVLKQQVRNAGLLIQSGKVVGAQSAEGMYYARHVVITAGCWTDQLLEPLGIQLGIEPIRGQLVFYDSKREAFAHPVYTKTGGYIAPKKDGYALAGSTTERVGFDSSTTEDGIEMIRHFAKTLFPHLSHAQVRGSSAGLRPKSPDELPIIGALPDHPNLIVAAGHYRNGILLAPITGQIVAAIVSGAEPPLDISPFSPKRLMPASSSAKKN